MYPVLHRQAGASTGRSVKRTKPELRGRTGPYGTLRRPVRAIPKPEKSKLAKSGPRQGVSCNLYRYGEVTGGPLEGDERKGKSSATRN